MFPGADDKLLDLLQKMLQVNPENRISAAKALESAIFNSFRDKSAEKRCKEPLNADFESQCEEAADLFIANVGL